MNVLLIRAIFFAGILPLCIRASDAEMANSNGKISPEEPGVITHGTILAVRSHQIVVLTQETREPVRYSHGEGTVYVDESGNPITLRTVKSGVPVIVFYTQAKDERMANRVIVVEPGSLPRSCSLADRLLH